MDRPDFKQISNETWEIAKSFKSGMRVPARVYATKKLFDQMEDGVFDQLTNVATLPGIRKYAVALPDSHIGYGFPIGGVAAFDVQEGVISPGGIGFDINCGVRLITTRLIASEIGPRIHGLIDLLFTRIPGGLGRGGLIGLNRDEFKKILEKGAEWCLEKGFGRREDLERIEEGGRMREADAAKVSERAIARGIDQVGSLGSGNHYLEVQKVAKIFDPELAQEFNLSGEGQVTVMIHCGSRGLGHQVATDYLRIFSQAVGKYGLSVPDRQLVCAPFKSREGQDYFSAMACAVNMAFANRQMIMDQVRKSFEEFFGRSAENLGMDLVYDVAHNIAKVEEYEGKELVVHRKGATRALGPGNPKLPKIYRKTGQPVIIGGSMETKSYLLAGTKKAEEDTFGSTCHGSGRTMSRAKAKTQVSGKNLQEKMKTKGIYVRTSSFAGLAEEAGVAYKDIDEVIRAVSLSGISRPVASFFPIGNIKG